MLRHIFQQQVGVAHSGSGRKCRSPPQCGPGSGCSGVFVARAVPQDSVLPTPAQALGIQKAFARVEQQLHPHTAPLSLRVLSPVSLSTVTNSSDKFPASGFRKCQKSSCSACPGPPDSAHMPGSGDDIVAVADELHAQKAAWDHNGHPAALFPAGKRHTAAPRSRM